jgi:hypothetical protein
MNKAAAAAAGMDADKMDSIIHYLQYGEGRGLHSSTS